MWKLEHFGRQGAELVGEPDDVLYVRPSPIATNRLEILVENKGSLMDEWYLCPMVHNIIRSDRGIRALLGVDDAGMLYYIASDIKAHWLIDGGGFRKELADGSQ